MLLLAGRTAITERGLPDSRSLSIHWAQESFDRAGLLREFVKWDYELRRGDQLETVVDRALAIACSPPAGPVYLTLPVDVIGAPMPPLTIVLDPTQACSTRPGTFFNHAHSAVLGWGPGAALGAKMAHPDRTVVCAVGDGSHVFGVPTSTHHTARACDLPVLFVVCNNAGWERTRQATLEHAPEGWAARQPSMPLCDLAPPPAYDAICEANGGYGERVEDPASCPPRSRAPSTWCGASGGRPWST